MRIKKKKRQKKEKEKERDRKQKTLLKFRNEIKNKDLEREKSILISPGLENSVRKEISEAGGSGEGRREETQGRSDEEVEETLLFTPKTGKNMNLPVDVADIFLDAKKKIALWTVKLRHITSWKVGGDRYIENNVKDLVKEEEEAMLEFLNKELKWRDKNIVKTKWSLR